MPKPKKQVGFNYLHRHPTTEQQLGIDAEHVIVDIDEIREVNGHFLVNDGKKIIEIDSKIDSQHAIINRKKWEEAVDYFHNNPQEVEKLGKSKHESIV